MTPLALIPAKGVSERLPGKNLRLLAGRPLLWWTIAAARQSGVFADLWVSSESAEVLALAAELGAQPLRRPADLASPEATISDVIVHARQALEWRGPIAILAPTNPFRAPRTIAAACQQFALMPYAGAFMSMSPMPHPPEWAFRFDASSGAVRPLEPDSVNLPRSALTPAWRPDGCHYLLGDAARVAPPFGFASDPIEAVDINTPDDLAYAEYLLTTGRVPWTAATSSAK